MRNCLRTLGRIALLTAVWLGAGCSALEDNATHLAAVLEQGAADLRTSYRSDMVYDYEPLGGLNEDYYIEMVPSEKSDAPYGGYIVVGGLKSGGTSYHGRFVYVPKRLYVQKHNAATKITLRKNGTRIEVVDLQ
jgi:hypothetical protein